jgi:hypothetical protein
MTDFYVLYAKFSNDRYYREKYQLPITDQWHIYGREGERYPFCVSRNLEKLEEVAELMRKFQTMDITVHVEETANHIDLIEEEYIIADYFYFESCFNNCSFAPLDVAKMMFEEHVNDKYKMMNTFDSFYPTIVMDNCE